MRYVSTSIFFSTFWLIGCSYNTNISFIRKTKSSNRYKNIKHLKYKIRIVGFIIMIPQPRSKNTRMCSQGDRATYNHFKCMHISYMTFVMRLHIIYNVVLSGLLLPYITEWNVVDQLLSFIIFMAPPLHTARKGTTQCLKSYESFLTLQNMYNQTRLKLSLMAFLLMSCVKVTEM